MTAPQAIDAIASTVDELLGAVPLAPSCWLPGTLSRGLQLTPNSRLLIRGATHAVAELRPGIVAYGTTNGVPVLLIALHATCTAIAFAFTTPASTSHITMPVVTSHPDVVVDTLGTTPIILDPDAATVAVLDGQAGSDRAGRDLPMYVSATSRSFSLVAHHTEMVHPVVAVAAAVSIGRGQR